MRVDPVGQVQSQDGCKRYRIWGSRIHEDRFCVDFIAYEVKAMAAAKAGNLLYCLNRLILNVSCIRHLAGSFWNFT